MTEFEENTLTMYDDEGNETRYQVLCTKNVGDDLYMLAEYIIDDDASEVLLFKCKDDGKSEEMIFELVDEDHDSFEPALALFKEIFDELEIEY